MTPDAVGWQRYRSRTFWIVQELIVIASALAFYLRAFDTWVASVTLVLTLWQGRRAWDNRLAANGKGGGKEATE